VVIRVAAGGRRRELGRRATGDGAGRNITVDIVGGDAIGDVAGSYTAWEVTGFLVGARNGGLQVASA
jgi:hypothetical protein